MAGSARIDELKKKFDENPGRYFAPLANEYRKAGEIEQAITICRTYLAEKPGHMSGLIVFGQALFEAGQFEEARTTFEQALALDPENLIALRHLGDIARDVGDPASARNWYQRVLDADPRNEEIAAQLAAVTDAVAAAPAAASAPVESGGMSGWGDINPEQGAPADPVVSSASTLVIEAVPVRPSPFAEPARPSLQLLAIDEPPPAPEIERESPPLEFDTTSFGGQDTPSAVSDSLGIERAQEFDIDAARRGMGGLELDQPFDASPEIASASPSDLGLEPTEFTPPSADEAAAAADMRVSLAFEPSDDLMSAMEMASSSTPALSPDVTPQAEEPTESPEESELEPVSAAESRASRSFEEPQETASPSGFVTETMAELYLKQGYRAEAVAVYRQLVQQNPGDSSLRDKLQKAEEPDDARETATPAEPKPAEVAAAASFEYGITPAPAAPASPTSGSGRSARSFFGALASRRAPQRASDPYLSDVASSADEGPAESGVTGPSDWIMESGSSAGSGAEIPPSAPPISADAFGASEQDWPEPAETPSAEVDTGWGIAPVTAPTAASVSRDASPTHEVREAETPSMSGSLDSLFAGAAVPAADENAASMLAGAFGPPDLSSAPPPMPVTPAQPTAASQPSQRGQPTRAASSELSLDHVFRDSPRKSGAVRQTGGFSFDQFFSDSAVANSPAPDGTDSGTTGGNATTEDEVGQFTSWLEGLKKK